MRFMYTRMTQYPMTYMLHGHRKLSGPVNKVSDALLRLLSLYFLVLTCDCCHPRVLDQFWLSIPHVVWLRTFRLRIYCSESASLIQEV